MNKVTRRLLAIAMSFAMALGISAATAAPANAGVQPTVIANMTGANIRVYCVYGKSAGGTIYEVAKLGPYLSTSHCPVDVDQWYQPHTRCMHFAGPKYADGYYKVKAGKYKMSGLAVARFYAWSKCSGKTLKGTWTLK